MVVDEEPDIAELDLPPGGSIESVEIELGAQPLDVLADALVVEADSLLHRRCASAHAACSKRRFACPVVFRKSR